MRTEQLSVGVTSMEILPALNKDRLLVQVLSLVATWSMGLCWPNWTSQWLLWMFFLFPKLYICIISPEHRHLLLMVFTHTQIKKLWYNQNYTLLLLSFHHCNIACFSSILFTVDIMILLTRKVSIWTFYHGLCLKGKPWSCGHPLGMSGIISMNRQEQTCLLRSATDLEQ